jgi:hypothetical protein
VQHPAAARLPNEHSLSELRRCGPPSCGAAVIPHGARTAGLCVPSSPARPLLHTEGPGVADCGYPISFQKSRGLTPEMVPARQTAGFLFRLTLAAGRRREAPRIPENPRESPRIPRSALRPFSDQVLVLARRRCKPGVGCDGVPFLSLGQSSSCFAPAARTGLASGPSIRELGHAHEHPPARGRVRWPRQPCTPGPPGRGERRAGRRRFASAPTASARTGGTSLTTPSCGHRLADNVGYGQARSQRKRCVSSRGGMHGKT